MPASSSAMDMTAALTKSFQSMAGKKPKAAGAAALESGLAAAAKRSVLEKVKFDSPVK